MSPARFGLDMPDSPLKQYQHNSLSQFFSTYSSVCGLLYRKHDLEQLIKWATRKGLDNPRRFYTRLCIDTDQRLWHWQHRAPYASALAECAVNFAHLFQRKERFSKGYALKFRN